MTHLDEDLDTVALSKIAAERIPGVQVRYTRDPITGINTIGLGLTLGAQGQATDAMTFRGPGSDIFLERLVKVLEREAMQVFEAAVNDKHRSLTQTIELLEGQAEEARRAARVARAEALEEAALVAESGAAALEQRAAEARAAVTS